MFSDTKGQTVGWCFGSRKRETTLANLLRVAVGESGFLDWLSMWQEATARREILETFRVLQIHRLPSSEISRWPGVRSHLCNVHRIRLGVPVRDWLRCLESYSRALAAEEVGNYVGDPALVAFPVPGLHLGEVFADLMQWQLHQILGLSLSERTLHESPSRWAASAMEEHGAELRMTLGRLLGSLELVLRERVG